MVSLEKARTDRPKEFTYFTIHMNVNTCEEYPDIPLEAWAVLSWFKTTYTNVKMKKHITKDGYLWISSSLVISRLWSAGIRDTSAVSRCFKWLCGEYRKEGDTKKYFLEKKTAKSSKVPGYNMVLFRPTDMMAYACQNDNELADQIDTKEWDALEEEEEVPPEKKEPEVLSDTLFDFYALLKKSTTAFDHHKPPSNDKPSKLWLNTDKYIKELMEGTFYENNKDKFDKKAEDRGAIPKLTLPQIAELCKNVKVYSANGKPSIDNVFMQFDGKVFKSPLLNYIWASLPPPMPTYSPEHIEELKAKYISSKEMLSTVALNKASINRDNPYIYLLMDKMMDFFDDETRERLGKYNKKAPTKLDLTHLPDWCIMSFNSYRDSWKKKATWQTWEEWVQAFKVDDRKKYTPWFWKLYWVRKNSNGRFHLSEDTSIRTKIDDMIAHPYVGEDNGGY